MINDPYMGTTHNSDLTVVMPVFVDGEHLFWTAVRAHRNNTGEASFGYASTSVWQDGIQIPPVRIFERGREIRSTIRFYLRNVRLPDWLDADLRAMVGAVRAGAARLQDMTRTHGVDVVVPTLAEMINYAERRTAAEIRALPDGVYHGEGWIDSDGQGTHDIRIACTVTIDDDTIHVDFTGSDPQAGGHCNATVATMEACGSIPVLTVIDPTIPRNDGCMRRIRVTAPEGSVEMVELLQPLFVEYNEFLADSAGAGTWIGGHGIETSVRPIDGILYMKFEYEGTFNPPFGLFGGQPGNGGCKYKERADGSRRFYMGHPDPDVINEGERYVTVTTGGGGYGNPFERPASAVRDLVEDEFLTVEAARERFGVAIDPVTLAINQEKTDSLRAGHGSAADQPLWLPQQAGEGDYWKQRFREGDELVREIMPDVLRLGLSPEAR